MDWNLVILWQLIGFFGQYLLFAGGAFLFLYILLPKFFLHRKIQAAFPNSADVHREILYSLQSLTIFAALAVGCFGMAWKGWTRFYFSVEAHGWPYFWFSIVLLILIHDTWFYWTHRFLHWGPVYRVAHRLHHRSHHPTPWAAFAFHPIEAVIQGLIYPLVILMMPIHPLAGMIWLIYMGAMNVFLHLGFELLPTGFVRHWFFRWHNTSVHHDMHHNHAHSNYGLYFNFWDRIMGTNHKEYETTFEKVTQARAQKKKCKKQKRSPSLAA